MHTPLTHKTHALMLFSVSIFGSVAHAKSIENMPLESSLYCGYAIHKSKLAASNDTGYRADLDIAAHAGDSKRFATVTHVRMEKTTFSLVEKAFTGIGFTSMMRAYLGPFYIGPLIGFGSGIFSQPAATSLNFNELDYGGHMGIKYGANDTTSFQMNVSYAQPWAVSESHGTALSVGYRVEGDLGILVKHNEVFHSGLGVRYSRYSLQSQLEQVTLPYIGFSLKNAF